MSGDRTLNILFTTEQGTIKDLYFPAEAIAKLQKLGNVIFNEKDRPLSEAELASCIQGIEVCITHWDCPVFTQEVLEKADRLRLIVHAAGSVADLVTDQVYERGIKVCSANTVMAKHVAEGVLAYMLAGLRWIPQQAFDVQDKKVWRKRVIESNSLMGAKIGLVGLGTIGRFLLDFLKPFAVQIKLYDPYLSPELLREHPNVELCPLDEVLEWGDIISIHASLTSETRGMLNADRLRMIKDDALLVNTARGAIVDEWALINELQKGRIRAVLDVYKTEPLPLDSALRNLDNVILLPHVAGITARQQMTYAMLEEIERYKKGEPLQYEIPFEKFELMTKEH